MLLLLLAAAALGRAAALADARHVRGHAPADGVLAAGNARDALRLADKADAPAAHLPLTVAGDKDDALVAAAHLSLARAEAAVEHSSQALAGKAAAPRFSSAAGGAAGAGAGAVAVVGATQTQLGDPISAISLTLKSLAFVMNQASAHMESQTQLKKETGDKFVGKIAAALAVDGDKLTAAYQALLADVGTRVSDSVRDVAEAVVYNLCADNALAVASSIRINKTEQLSNAALTYAGGDDIVNNFEAARLRASASGATEDDKLELKRKLFVLGAWGGGGAAGEKRARRAWGRGARCARRAHSLPAPRRHSLPPPQCAWTSRCRRARWQTPRTYRTSSSR